MLRRPTVISHLLIGPLDLAAALRAATDPDREPLLASKRILGEVVLARDPPLDDMKGVGIHIPQEMFGHAPHDASMFLSHDMTKMGAISEQNLRSL